MPFWLSIKFWEGTYFSSCMCACVHIFVCICVLALRMNCQSRHFYLSSDAGNFFMIIFLLLTFIHSPYFLLWTFPWISLGTFRHVLHNSYFSFVLSIFSVVFHSQRILWLRSSLWLSSCCCLFYQ